MNNKKHPDLIKFGKHIRALRLTHGYSQESFAEACAIDRTYMSGIERGLRNISILVTMQIAKTLGVALAELLSPINEHGNMVK